MGLKKTFCKETMEFKVKWGYTLAIYLWLRSNYSSGGACGVMVIVIENGLGDLSSNPGLGYL